MIDNPKFKSSWFWGALSLFSLLAVPVTGADSDAQTGGCCEKSAPELWVVNSRGAPRCSGLDEGFNQLTFDHFDEVRCVFVRESLEAFLAAQADVPTMLFSHGNTLTHEEAMESCWSIRERLRTCSGKKILVFWSWPAEKIYTRTVIRPIKMARENVRIKYGYAEHQGYYIAKLANQMSTAQPLTLSGHSYGGLSVISALHFLGGGQLNGLVLAGGAAVERHNLRAAIVSGALDCDLMAPGQRYGQSFAPVEIVYSTYNDRDTILKRWPIHSSRGQEAAGYIGICAASLGPYSHKLLQQRLTEDVGKSHYMEPHLASERMITAICNLAFPASQTGLCNCPHCQSSANFPDTIGEASADSGAELSPSDRPANDTSASDTQAATPTTPQAAT